MATRTISVTTRATLAAGSNPNGYGDDVTITNTGTATAYLDSDQPDSTTSGQPLSAGSSLTWSKDQPLWTVAPVATTLVVSENTGAIFDAGAIAAQILAQGLASQIATAINVVGVPAIESATVLQSFSSVTALNANPGIGGSPIDCSRYQSLRVYCSETYAIGGAYPPPRPYTISWYADAAGTIPVGVDAFNVPTGTNAALVPAASAVVSVPCRGPYFVLGAQSVSVGPSTVGAIVLGSYRPAQDLKWSKLTDGFSGSSGAVVTSALGDQGGTFSISSALAAGTTTDYPILPGGDCLSMLAIGANTAQCSFQIRDLYNNRFIYNRPIPVTAAPGSMFVERLVLPNSPISVAAVIAGAAVSTNWTLVGVDRA
jgi:hypothetical protein